MTFAVIAHGTGRTNLSLVSAGWPGRQSHLLTPSEAAACLVPGDVALGRIDVRPTLDGVEPGLRTLGRLAARGVLVLNPPSTLLGCHDKLLTARRLKRALIPHPRTAYVTPLGPTDVEVTPPFVVKPRYGSWGFGIRMCEDEAELRACLDELATEPWFHKQGALIQELVPPLGFDLRLVVSGGEIVGAIERVAARGEWRTNVALGAVRRTVAPDPQAEYVALAAAAAVGGDLVGVDLLPIEGDGYVVLEVNGAVDFTSAYSLGEDVFTAATSALARSVADRVAAAPGPLA